MEDEIFNVNFQIKQSIIEQTNVEKNVPNERNEMERNLQTLHTQRKYKKVTIGM
jgi:hypothetical protein